MAAEPNSRSASPASHLGRRRFLKRGLVGGVLLVGAGTLPFAFRSTLRRTPHAPLRLLTAEEYAVLAAVAARVAPGDGAGPNWPTAEALDCAGKIDALLARLHPDAGSDLRRLLRLFESSAFGPGGGGIAAALHARDARRARRAAGGLADVACRPPAQRLPGHEAPGRGHLLLVARGLRPGRLPGSSRRAAGARMSRAPGKSSSGPSCLRSRASRSTS